MGSGQKGIRSKFCRLKNCVHLGIKVFDNFFESQLCNGQFWYYKKGFSNPQKQAIKNDFATFGRILRPHLCR